jgi:hypothetical protein
MFSNHGFQNTRRRAVQRMAEARARQVSGPGAGPGPVATKAAADLDAPSVYDREAADFMLIGPDAGSVLAAWPVTTGGTLGTVVA